MDRNAKLSKGEGALVEHRQLLAVGRREVVGMFERLPEVVLRSANGVGEVFTVGKFGDDGGGKRATGSM